MLYRPVMKRFVKKPGAGTRPHMPLGIGDFETDGLYFLPEFGIMTPYSCLL